MRGRKGEIPQLKTKHFGECSGCSASRYRYWHKGLDFFLKQRPKHLFCLLSKMSVSTGASSTAKGRGARGRLTTAPPPPSVRKTSSLTREPSSQHDKLVLESVILLFHMTQTPCPSGSPWSSTATAPSWPQAPQAAGRLPPEGSRQRSVRNQEQPDP